MNKEELDELSMSNLQKVMRALDKGDIEEAKKCALVMEEEAKHAHDLMVDFVWTLLTYIGNNYGDEEVMKALRFRHKGKAQVAERMLGMTPEEAVRFKTMIHRAHHSNMSLSEEEDRFVLKLDPCNTGGRMRREGLDREPVNLGKVKKGFPESWNRPDVSYYCVHCGLHSIMSVEKGAPHPTWIYVCPEDPREPCLQYCYKTTAAVPEKYFEELGLRKEKE